MNEHISPPIQKSIEHIKSKIDQGHWKNGDRIPSSRMLAAQVDVGTGSIGKAIKLLIKQKVLASKEKVGVFVGSELPVKRHAKALIEKIPKQEKIKESLKWEILQGQYHHLEFLPSLKELQNEFETSYQMVKNAVEILVEEKLLKQSKRSYRIVNYTAPHPRNVIYLIMSQDALNGALWAQDKLRMDEFVQSLEKECTLKKTRLIKHQAGRPFPHSVSQMHVLGFIIWLDINMNDEIVGLFAQLTPIKKPITLINKIYDIGKEWAVKWTEETKINANLFVSDVSREVDAGYAIGKHLITKGHKKVGYIAHINNERVGDHFTGLTRAFNNVGLKDCIFLSLVQEPSDVTANLLTQSNQQGDKDVATRNKLFERTQTILARTLPASVASLFGIQMQEANFAANYLHFYRPAFSKLLNQSGITAWICQDDSVACYGALEFIKSQNIRYPEKIGLMGCYDMPISSLHGLSSYHYDYAGAARKMLNLVLYPEYAKKTLCIKGTTVFTVDGMVIDRSSA